MTSPPSGEEPRPFRVLGLQQVAIGHRDKSELTKLWVDLLGLSVARHYRSEAENVDEDLVFLGHGRFAVELDLMQPIDVGRSPRVDVPALNHIGLWVTNLDAAVTWLQARGVRFAGEIRRGAAGYRVAFIHPKGDDTWPQSGAGVLLELVEASQEIELLLESGT